MDLCWGEDTRSSDPHNALKSVIHRIRATLDKLQEGLGRTLLRRKAGCYIWNTDVPLEVDAEVFDTLCNHGAALEGDERLEAYQQALALYSNDVLPKLAGELWLVPITTYYHQRYVQTAEESIQLLDEQDRLQEAILLARQAVRIEPYQERLYAQLIRTLLKMGNQRVSCQKNATKFSKKFALQRSIAETGRKRYSAQAKIFRLHASLLHAEADILLACHLNCFMVS